MAPTNKPIRSGKSLNNREDKSHQMFALANVSRFRGDFIPCNYEAAKTLYPPFQEINLETDQVAVAKVPSNVEDYDKAIRNNIFKVPQYAAEIVQYLKQREDKFPIIDYKKMQEHISMSLRAVIVDWIVEMQMKLGLDQNTLYLAVKILDRYLCKVIITQDQLQLLGSTALLIASKYEKRNTVCIDDLLYFSDGSYTRSEVMAMEVRTLKAIDYNLGIPLSYGFLRRYALCARIPKPTLVLSLYILEKSLMFYETIRFKDSQMAAAALFIALRMHGHPKPWTPTLEFYSGYALTEFAKIVHAVNFILHLKFEALINIRTKYSYTRVYKVAMVQLKSNDELLENNIVLGNCIKKEVVESGKKHNFAVAKETVSRRPTEEKAV